MGQTISRARAICCGCADADDLDLAAAGNRLPPPDASDEEWQAAMSRSRRRVQHAIEHNNPAAALRHLREMRMIRESLIKNRNAAAATAATAADETSNRQ